MRHTEPIFTMKTPFRWMGEFLPLFHELRESSLNGAPFNSLNGLFLPWNLPFVRFHPQSLGDSRLLGNLPLSRNSELLLLFPLLHLPNGSRG